MLRFEFLGEALALASGIAWAGAVILFRITGRKIHPLALNLYKSVLAFVVMAVTLVGLGKSVVPAMSGEQTLLLVLSGVLGIAVADTLFFQSLNLLGASLLAIVNCLYSPVVIGLSYLFLGERMTGWQFVGVALIISAILTVAGKNHGEPVPWPQRVKGLILGILAVLSIAVSIVIIKPILGAVPVISATFVRLGAGALALVFILPFYPHRRKILKPLGDIALWKVMAPAAFLGSYLSLLFWIGGMKYALASVAASLNQLTTIFTVIFAAIFLKERLTAWKIAAVILAFVGVTLVTLF